MGRVLFTRKLFVQMRKKVNRNRDDVYGDQLAPCCALLGRLFRIEA
jgi:hypothetical protein